MSIRSARGGGPSAGEWRDSERPPVSYVVAATFSIAVFPVLCAAGLLYSFFGRFPLVVAILSGIVLGILAFVVGDAVWSRRDESRYFAFWDLMIWNAFRRVRAERSIKRKAHLLGFDLEGRFAGHARVPLDQQVEIARDISHAIESKSAYSRGHSQRVERHARRMATVLGLSTVDAEQLSISATLHDIGNIRIPHDVLHKAEELTSQERAAIENHVVLGSAMAFTAGSAQVMEAVRHHHEWWDGSGYPSRLVGEEIPLFARIISIGEAYDAMVSPRPYRHGYSRRRAIEVLREQAGSQFDPRLVDVFVRTLPQPLRSAVLLPLVAVPRRMEASFRSVGAVSVALAGATVAVSVVLATAILTPGSLNGPSSTLRPQPFRPGGGAPLGIAAGDTREEPDRGGGTRRNERPPEVADGNSVAALGESVPDGGLPPPGGEGRDHESKPPEPSLPPRPEIPPPVEEPPGGGGIQPEPPIPPNPGQPARPDEDSNDEERGDDSDGKDKGEGHGKDKGEGHGKDKGEGHGKDKGEGHGPEKGDDGPSDRGAPPDVAVESKDEDDEGAHEESKDDPEPGGDRSPDRGSGGDEGRGHEHNGRGGGGGDD